MKVCVLIILIVIQAMTCEKAVSKLRRKLIVPKMNDECKKIKCASVDDPQCVRMRRQDLRLVIHIIAANKCEMEYMKCHDDVEAKIVPMKYCSHNVDLIAGKKKNKMGKAHIRVKRSIQAVEPDQHIQLNQPTIKAIPLKQSKDESSTTEKPKTGFKDNNNKFKHPKFKKSGTNSKKLFLQLKNEDSNIIPKDNDNRSTMKGHGAAQHARQALVGYPFSSESDSDIESNERKKISKGVAGHLLNIDTGPQNLHLSRDYDLSQIEGSQGSSQTSSTSGSQESGPEFLMLSEKSGKPGPEFSMLSGESANFSKESLTNADKIEFEKVCPKICPSRDVMVCAKCNHGIYRTFLSVCHLRMFTCNHQDETMRLITRHPCVLSAPYISEANQLKGRVREPGDDDKVLRFIMCRDQGKLGTDDTPPEDPRCNFRPAKDTLKFYDYKGVDLPMDDLIEFKESSEC